MYSTNSTTTERRPLLIGQVAAQSGFSIKTIRYYEELGLIKADGRTSGGFRQFAPFVLTRLAFIKRIQSLGLSLQQIRECLQVYDRGDLPCDEIKRQMEAKLVEIESKIKHLQMLKADLIQQLTAFDCYREAKLQPEKPVLLLPDKICPIIQKE